MIKCTAADGCFLCLIPGLKLRGKDIGKPLETGPKGKWQQSLEISLFRLISSGWFSLATRISLRIAKLNKRVSDLLWGGEICRICTCCKKATLKKRLSWFCFSFLLSRDWRTKPKKILHLICHKTCVSWCLEAANVKTLGVAWNVII